MLFSQHIDWKYTYGGSGDDIISSIIEARDGGYIIVGYSNSKNGDITHAKDGFDYWVIRLDENGVIKWENKFGGSSDYDFGFDAIENEKGEILVAGSSFSNDGDRNAKECLGDDDIWLINLSREGKIIWEKTYGGSMKDRPVDLVYSEEGDILLLSNTKSRDNQVKHAHGKQEIWLTKLKSNGKIQWSHAYGGTRNERGTALIETNNNTFLILGETESRNGDATNRKSFQYDAWVIKIDHKGRVIWQKTYGGSKDDIIKDAVELYDGSFIVVGETESDDGHIKVNKGAFDSWVLRIDASGNVIWQKTYGGSNIDFASSLSIDPMTNIIHVFGATASVDGDVVQKKGSVDIWLLSIDKNGKIVGNRSFGGNNIEEPYDMIMDKRGNIILAATTLSEDGHINQVQRYENEDIWIIKLSPKNEVLVQEKEMKEINCMVKTYAGGYLFGGSNTIDENNHNIFLQQFDATGTEMFSRNWSTNATDQINSIIKSNDGTGSYFAIGTTRSNDTIFDNKKGNADIFFMKLTATGEIKLVKPLGGSNDDEGKQLFHMNKNQLVIIGNTKSTDGDIMHAHKGDGDIWVTLVDKIGKIKWENNYGGFGNDVCTKGLLTYKKQIAIIGYSNSADADIKHCFGNKDGIFMLLDNEGKMISQSNFGGNGNDWFQDVIQTSDGSFIIVGATKSNNISDKIKGGSDYYVVKTTGSGKIIWEKTFGGSGNDEAVSIIAHSREEFIIAGSSASSDGDVKGNKGESDIWVIKIDANGKLIDQKSFGKPGNQFCKQMIKLSSFKYLIGGYGIDDNFNKKIWFNEFKF